MKTVIEVTIAAMIVFLTVTVHENHVSATPSGTRQVFVQFALNGLDKIEYGFEPKKTDFDEMCAYIILDYTKNILNSAAVDEHQSTQMGVVNPLESFCISKRCEYEIKLDMPYLFSNLAENRLYAKYIFFNVDYNRLMYTTSKEYVTYFLKHIDLKNTFTYMETAYAFCDHYINAKKICIKSIKKHNEKWSRRTTLKNYLLFLFYKLTIFDTESVTTVYGEINFAHLYMKSVWRQVAFKANSFVATFSPKFFCETFHRFFYR